MVSPVFQATFQRSGETSVMVPPASVSVGSAMLSVVTLPSTSTVAARSTPVTPKVTSVVAERCGDLLDQGDGRGVGVGLQAQLDVEGIVGDVRFGERELAGRLEIVVQAVVGDDVHVAPGLAVDRAGDFERVGDRQRDRRQLLGIAAGVGVDGREGDDVVLRAELVLTVVTVERLIARARADRRGQAGARCRRRRRREFRIPRRSAK